VGEEDGDDGGEDAADGNHEKRAAAHAADVGKPLALLLATREEERKKGKERID